MTAITVTAADRTGITTSAGHMTWATAIQAANQEDATLSAAYRDILRAAHKICTDQQYSQSALDMCRAADLDAARPKLTAAEIQSRDATQTAADNAVIRAEIMDIRNDRHPRSPMSDEVANARIKHLADQIIPE